MGATGLHREAGMTDVEFFAKQFSNWEYEIVAASTAAIANPYEWQREYYAAMRNPETGETFALVVLYSRRPGGYENFYYKELTETMGIGTTSFPSAAVLDALTPTENERALAWRAASRANIAALAAKPKVKPGDLIRFAKGFSFTNGITTTPEDKFEVVERDVLRVRGLRVKLPRWRGTLDWALAS